MKSILHLMAASLLLASMSTQALVGWSDSTSLVIGTTKDWAFIPDSVTIVNFPLLVRLDSNTFEFSSAKANGEDIRFTKEDGTLLPYEIEVWNATAKYAAIWVQIDTIRGNELQVLKMFWGNSSAASESNGPAVFNRADNSICGVYHFSPASPFADASDFGNNGTNNGTTEMASHIGNGRNFFRNTIVLDSSVTRFLGVGQGTMSFWIKTDTTINGGAKWNSNSLLGADSDLMSDTWWGILNEGHVGITPSSSPAAMSHKRVDDDTWHYVAITREAATGRVQVYVDGICDTIDTLLVGDMVNNVLNTLGKCVDGRAIPVPTDLTDSGYVIGNFDEIRIVDTLRSAEWIKLSYESQRSLPTLVSRPRIAGCVDEFSVEGTSFNVNEGERISIGGTATCSFIAKWSMIVDGDSLVPVQIDGSSAVIIAGRVVGDTSRTFRFSALYGTDPGTASWQTKDVTVNIIEKIPDPVFSITGDSAFTDAVKNSWNGLTTLVIYPKITNLSDITSSMAQWPINSKWTILGMVVIANQTQYINVYNNVVTSDTLSLSSPFSNGVLSLELCLDNGGLVSRDTVDITIALKDAFEFTIPKGDTVNNGEEFTLTWKTIAPDVKTVKIEYQVEFGFSFTSVGDSIPNTGTYTFTMPFDMASASLIWFKITDVASGLSATQDSIPLLVVGTKFVLPGEQRLSFNVQGNGRILTLKRGDFNRLDIIDVKGVTIRSLPIESENVFWDGTNTSGRKVHPGFYIVRFIGKRNTMQRKIIMMK